MDDIANSKTLAVEVARFIEDHKGRDTVALYVGERSSFTDCFVITTASSEAHLGGLYKNLLEMFSEKKLELLHRRKALTDEGWLIMDLGRLVVHLMTTEKRSFYDLERLWFEGEKLYHSSSKSS